KGGKLELDGEILGDPAAEFSGPLPLAIDITPAVADQALAAGASAVVAYHPPLWSPIRRLTPDTPKGASLLRLLATGVAVYSPHTALDAAPGGVTDWLCDMLAEPGADPRALGDRRPLSVHAQRDPNATHKIVTFVPADAADRVRDALASVGAGRIGRYLQCSFSSPGVGTFFGDDTTRPAVGEAGSLQTADELRLEMVCPEAALALAVEMLRRFHPYEEPAFDIVPLAPKPRRDAGAGRRLTLDRPTDAQTLARRLRENLGVDAVKLAAASDEPVARVGVCPGAGAALLDAAVADGCTLFVTGEMRHHEALDALARGCSVLLAGHTNTERGYLPHYAERINSLLPDARARTLDADRPIFRTLA
ncbi:MAG: Nif3-like dinuclear metal center hexameric protein, partial [Planctomycetota bacterium]